MESKYRSLRFGADFHEFRHPKQTSSSEGSEGRQGPYGLEVTKNL